MHNLFLPNFVNLYMFQAYLGPSSGATTVCMQQLLLIILFKWLSVSFQSNEDNRQSSKKNNKYQLLYTYGCTYLLMMDLDTPETCRRWRNVLRISCASSWLFFHNYIEIHGQQNITFRIILSWHILVVELVWSSYHQYSTVWDNDSIIK